MIPWETASYQLADRNAINPAASLEAVEIKQEVSSHLAKLKPLDQLVIILRYYQDLNYDEIAYILDTTRNNVEVRLCRARQRLRQIWEKQGGEKMLNCSEAEELLDLYLDQELDPPTKEKCEQHLCHCPRCSELLKLREQERETIINGFPVPKPTPALSKQIMEKIANPAQNRTPSKNSWLKKWMVPLAAACLLVLVIYGAFSQGIFSPPQDTMLID